MVGEHSSENLQDIFLSHAQLAILLMPFSHFSYIFKSAAYIPTMLSNSLGYNYLSMYVIHSSVLMGKLQQFY